MSFDDFIAAPEDANDICMNSGAFVAVLLALILAVVCAAVAAAFMAKKLNEKNSVLKKLDSGLSGVVMS